LGSLSLSLSRSRRPSFSGPFSYDSVNDSALPTSHIPGAARDADAHSFTTGYGPNVPKDAAEADGRRRRRSMPCLHIPDTPSEAEGKAEQGPLDARGEALECLPETHAFSRAILAQQSGAAEEDAPASARTNALGGTALGGNHSTQVTPTPSTSKESTPSSLRRLASSATEQLFSPLKSRGRRVP